MTKTQFYTGKGDRGDTARLQGKARLSKADALIDTIGTVDEATSAIGVARAQTQSPPLQEALLEVQRRLYRLMSHLSADAAARTDYPGLTNEDVAWLEDKIAQLEENLPALKEFVLPGDSPTGAACHMARTVVRRAERRLVALSEHEPNIGTANLAFMNRLSSFLFVAALDEDHRSGHQITLARSH